jgi:hypothetical protein
VLIPVLKDAGEISSNFGQLVIAAGTIADFGAVILLSVFFSGSGVATVVQQPGGRRLLTFSRFDVDPGVDVDVYLVPADGSDVSDRVELGSLKGNVGDQQYEIPAEADLNRYATVVLWCNPFTVRIAVAPLG